MSECKNIVIENQLFKLVVGDNAIVKSLILKETNEECLVPGEEMALFSVTQDRPFNNEIKLAYPCKHMVFQANRLRREGDLLTVGFELVPYEITVRLKETPNYVAFTMEDYIVHEDDYASYFTMDVPPVGEFRLIQLPIKNRDRYGDWLNVVWDNKVAINVLATSPHALIDSEKRNGFRIMTANAVESVKLRGCGAALIVSPADKLMDCVAAIEEDYDLPRGVESRRNKDVVASIYAASVTPANVDEHIAFAKQGGFRLIKIGDKSITRRHSMGGYSGQSDYRFNEDYPNGMEDLKLVLNKIKAAGIIPGLHILHTHVGMATSYVTPVTDYRLRLKRRFTLSRPLGVSDTVVYVAESTRDAVMFPKCRVLRFGGELITYESFVDEYPYRFIGCERGAYGTNITTHEMGLSGGILDITEFGATSCYVDQESDLQDLLADEIAKIYDAGFEFVYFDGSEGTNLPFEYHIPNAQYRVYKKLGKAPLFTEGAAKAHFSWHMLSGGNAFDRFPTEIFKAMLDEHPVKEAPRMQEDFTRIDFGWWGFYLDAGPDIYEYGTSRAAGWDCGGTICAAPNLFKAHPRFADIFEVFRRWEDVRAKNWLTEEQKRELQKTGVEHTLLINEKGEYEMVEYTQIKDLADKKLGAFTFTREDANYVTFWYLEDGAKLKLPLNAGDFVLQQEIGGEPIAVEQGDGYCVLPMGAKAYLRSSLSVEQLAQAFKAAETIA